MAKLRVEVIYALREAADRVELELDRGATARDAFEASGLRGRHPELGSRTPALGIYGHPVPPAQPLETGDRVEVYRSLVADPKDARRLRTLKKR